jgi:hypothetical protein
MVRFTLYIARRHLTTMIASNDRLYSVRTATSSSVLRIEEMGLTPEALRKMSMVVLSVRCTYLYTVAQMVPGTVLNKQNTASSKYSVLIFHLPLHACTRTPVQCSH